MFRIFPARNRTLPITVLVALAMSLSLLFAGGCDGGLTADLEDLEYPSDLDAGGFDVTEDPRQSDTAGDLDATDDDDAADDNDATDEPDVTDDADATDDVDDCTPESDEDFCLRHDIECGELTAEDNCGDERGDVECDDFITDFGCDLDDDCVDNVCVECMNDGDCAGTTWSCSSDGDCIDCNPDEEIGGGDGSINSPYRICHVDHLDHLRDHPEDDYELVTDISFDDNETFAPIDHTDGFARSLEGNGFEIRNLTINPGDGDSGLFAALADDADISDLVLAEVDIEGTENVGGLAGTSSGSIARVSVSGSVKNTEGSAETVGGIVGKNSGGTIKNSHSTAGISAANATYVGGIVGLLEGGELHESYAAADGIGQTSNSEANVGGLAGETHDGTTIEQCYAVSDVNVTTGNNTGGLVGEHRGDVSQSYATGDVEFTDTSGDPDSSESLGGLVGKNFGGITETYAYGEVSSSLTSSSVGGLVGDQDTSAEVIERSYWNESKNDPSEVGDGLSQSEFESQGSFDEWSFEDTWRLEGDDERPVLHCCPEEP